MEAKIAITGASGFVGSKLLRRLVKKHIVLTLPRDLIQASPTKITETMGNCDVLIHCASPLRHPTVSSHDFISIKKFLSTYLRDFRPFVINLSTVSIYGGSGRILESTHTSSSDAYSNGKIEIENLLSTIGVKHLNIRLPGVFGASGNPNFVMNLLKANQTVNSSLKLKNSHHRFNSFIWIDHLIALVEKVIKDHDHLGFESLNAVYRQPMLKQELVGLFPRIRFIEENCDEPEIFYGSIHGKFLDEVFTKNSKDVLADYINLSR